MTRFLGAARLLYLLIYLTVTARYFATNDTHLVDERLTNDGKIEKYLNLTHVQVLKDHAKNATRDEIVLRTLQAAAGVYRDKERGAKASLQKTVFMTVVAYNTKENIFHYKVYFRNFLCFVQHYEIDLIIYILHHHLPDVEEEIRSLELLGVKVLTYPDELFWGLLAEKKSKIMDGKPFSSYDSEIPNFHSYGALVMLIPQLEAMQLGFNVIYFDVDIGLVQDPVPYITRGDADFTTSIEQRHCPEEYPSSRRMEENWEGTEPNTGVMHLRATPQGLAMYKHWLRRIVRTNSRNDQMVFDRDARVEQVEEFRGKMRYAELNFTSTFTPSCNWGNPNGAPTVRASPTASTYCFLSEMLFQNGLNCFFCSAKYKHRDDWYLAMDRQLPEVQIDGQTYRIPVAVHANYCNSKSHELNVRGLWLYNEDMKHWDKSSVVPSSPEDSRFVMGCSAYNVSKVFFALMNFSAEIANINKYRDGLLKSVLVNGTLVKRVASEEVFLISEKLTKMLIPDGDTFLHMGYDWDSVRSVPSSVLFMVPEGPPFKSTSTKPPSKKKREILKTGKV